MRLHRFYISEPISARAEVIVVDADLVHQIRNVFRLKNGDSVILFDGSGSDYTCRIEGGDKHSITFIVIESSRSRYIPTQHVVLCAAVVKKDTFEWIAEKATELGVSEIVPVISERSEKKSLNESRLSKIVNEASEQSGRGDIPVLHSVIELREYIEKNIIDGSKMLAFHIDGPIFDRARFTASADAKTHIFIGPEGGWSPDELALFHSKKIPVVSLGTQVLRAETAVVSALSLTLLGK